MVKRVVCGASLGILVLVMGCAGGSVELDSVEGFDGVESATWLRLVEPGVEVGAETYDVIVLSTATRPCDRLSEALPAYQEVLEDDGLSEAEQFARGAELMDGMMGAGHAAAFVVSFDGVATNSWNAQLVPGEWTLDEDSELFAVQLSAFHDNPLAVAAEDEGEDQDDDPSAVSAYDVVEPWCAHDGSTRALEEAAGGALKGTASGTVSDEDGDSVGGFELSFHAPYCEVEVDAGVVWGLFLF